MNNRKWQQLFNYTDPLIRKALKRCGLYRTNPEYEDVFQELRIKVLLLTLQAPKLKDFYQRFPEDYLLNQFMRYGLAYMEKIWRQKHQEIPGLWEKHLSTPPEIEGVIIKDLVARFWSKLTFRERKYFLLIYTLGDDLTLPRGVRQYYQSIFKKKYQAL